MSEESKLRQLEPFDDFEDFEDLTLLIHIHTRGLGTVFFCDQADIQNPLRWLTETRKIILSSTNIHQPSAQHEIVSDWRLSTTWRRLVPSFLDDVNARIAVFFTDLESIPLLAITYLECAGYRELIFKEASRWWTLPLKRGLRSTSASMRLTLLLRKALLKTVGRKLPRKRHHFASDGGNCYQTSLPPFIPGNMPGDTRSTLLFYEDNHRLSEHHAPLDLVRTLGRGRFSHWDSSLYFSATDNSNPNSNGRKYRYVWLPGKLKHLKSYFQIPASELGPAASFFGSASPSFLKNARELMEAKTPFGMTKLGMKPHSICHFGGSLTAGGAERQIVYLIAAQRAQCEEVHFLACSPLDEAGMHYAPALEGKQVTIASASVPHPAFDWRLIFEGNSLLAELKLIVQLPDELRKPVWNVYTHLLVHKPRVLHCWLDYPNVIGAIAGWLAGVPRIVLSTRNVNPTHFPRFNMPWFRDWYQLMSYDDRVKWIANSKYGLEDYADWIGMEKSRFNLIWNGLDLRTIKAPTQMEVSTFRASLSIPEKASVIAGVLRLDSEKRPLLFLEIMARVREQIPELHVLVAGIGSLEKEFLEKITILQLGDRVHWLGRRTDVPLVMTAADVVALTSEHEGLPNVLIEAQWLSKPVVSSICGGVPEVVENGKTGLLIAQEDTDGFVQACVSLLKDPATRKKMGQAGHERIREHFSLEAMVEKSMRCYD